MFCLLSIFVNIFTPTKCAFQPTFPSVEPHTRYVHLRQVLWSTAADDEPPLHAISSLPLSRFIYPLSIGASRLWASAETRFPGFYKEANVVFGFRVDV